MAKSLGRLPSASTSRRQPIGPGPGEEAPAGQVKTRDLGLHEGRNPAVASTSLKRDAYRVGGAGVPPATRRAAR